MAESAVQLGHMYLVDTGASYFAMQLSITAQQAAAQPRANFALLRLQVSGCHSILYECATMRPEAQTAVGTRSPSCKAGMYTQALCVLA